LGLAPTFARRDQKRFDGFSCTRLGTAFVRPAGLLSPAGAIRRLFSFFPKTALALGLVKAFGLACRLLGFSGACTGPSLVSVRYLVRTWAGVSHFGGPLALSRLGLVAARFCRPLCRGGGPAGLVHKRPRPSFRCPPHAGFAAVRACASGIERWHGPGTRPRPGARCPSKREPPRLRFRAGRPPGLGPAPTDQEALVELWSTNSAVLRPFMSAAKWALVNLIADVARRFDKVMGFGCTTESRPHVIFGSESPHAADHRVKIVTRFGFVGCRPIENRETRPTGKFRHGGRFSSAGCGLCQLLPGRTWRATIKVSQKSGRRVARAELLPHEFAKSPLHHPGNRFRPSGVGPASAFSSSGVHVFRRRRVGPFDFQLWHPTNQAVGFAAQLAGTDHGGHTLLGDPQRAVRPDRCSNVDQSFLTQNQHATPSSKVGQVDATCGHICPAIQTRAPVRSRQRLPARVGTVQNCDSSAPTKRHDRKAAVVKRVVRRATAAAGGLPDTMAFFGLVVTAANG